MVCVAALVLIGCKPSAQAPAALEPVVADISDLSSAADAAWTAEQDRFLGINIAPSDPVDALMWRGVRCGFLGSEIGGDNSAQDRAIQARMEELRCGDDLLADARALRTARSDDPATVARLDALLVQY